MEDLIQSLPGYAGDLKQNMASVLRQTTLTPQQTWGTVVAAAIASRNPQLTHAAIAEAANTLSPDALDAARTAAAIMSMNNIFFRFRELSHNPRYATLPAGLRSNGTRTHNTSHLDFHLWCAAVSAINGCGACIVSHETALRAKGVTEETIESAIRIAAVVHAVAVILDAERR